MNAHRMFIAAAPTAQGLLLYVTRGAAGAPDGRIEATFTEAAYADATAELAAMWAGEAAELAYQAPGTVVVVPPVVVHARHVVGSTVVNFGGVARVLADDPLRGLLVEGIGPDARTGRWHAAPALTRQATLY